MSSTYTVTHGKPDDDFWDKYARLWQNSRDRSPFKSPHILRYFSERVQDRMAVFQYLKQGELLGTILLKENRGVYTFLSDLKTDVNFFVLDQRCSEMEEKEFFGYFLQTVAREKWSVILNNQPSWAHYMPAFEVVGQASGLFWMSFNYSVCPIVEADSPQALFDLINGSRELRYRVNKLKKQENAEFEVLTDDTDLEHWVEEFCQAHVLRWANTPTPSAFRDPERGRFLLDCLHAWNQDGILVRFAVKVARGRVGFVVGLREENSLIHHSTTFHPDYWKFSPGKALIHFMGQWMRDNGLRLLDFGDGNEPYKYDVANREHILGRIFISSRHNLPFIAKAKMIKAVKEHPRIYQFYQNRLKPLAAQAVTLGHITDWF